MNVPFQDLPLQYKTLQEPMDSAIKAVLESGLFIGGEEVVKFESAFAKQLGIDDCIGVGNGTDALFLSLKALGVNPGDGVLTAANSFIASAEAITMAGAIPVFVDCDPATYLMNLDLVEQILTVDRPGTPPIKAIIPVHLYGQAMDMTRVMAIARRFHLVVIEDCAQAHFAVWNGRPVGTFGDAGCFSFYPGKNLGAYGDAGAIVTKKAELADRLRKMHDHGRTLKYTHEFPGVNSRLDSLQAAILRVKLPNISAWNAKRRQHARLYRDLLKSVPEVSLPHWTDDERHVFHLFVIRAPSRDSLRQSLKEKGIATGVHYPMALPNTPAYKQTGRPPYDCPVATANQDHILSLPMFPELTGAQIAYVAETIKQTIHMGTC